MTAPAALTATQITHAFGDHRVLDAVDVSAQPGELIAVIGPNGAGKTTLLRAIAGVLDVDGGVVSLLPGEIGWVPQQPAIYGKLSVRENLALFAELEGVGDHDAVVETMLGQAGLTHRADDLVGTLSGGNQQRVNIAIGLLRAPTVLLLDEPSSSLDPYQRGRMWEFIAGLTQSGTAVLFTTHDVAEAERHADRVIVLAEGRVVYDLSPAELHSRAREAAGDPTADFETAFVALFAHLEHDADEVPA